MSEPNGAPPVDLLAALQASVDRARAARTEPVGQPSPAAVAALREAAPTHATLDRLDVLVRGSLGVPSNRDLRDEIAAAREMVAELTRWALSTQGLDSETRLHLGSAAQHLLAAEIAETGRLQAQYLHDAQASS